MHVRNGTEGWRTSIGVGQIDESIRRGSVTTGRCTGEPAFVEVHGSGVEVGRLPIGHRSQFQVVNPLLGSTTAQQVAAIGDVGVVELSPARAAVFGLPDVLVDAVA